MRLSKTMTMTIPHRLLPFSFFIASLALGPTARGQDSTPSPSPTASPAPVVVADPAVEVDEAQIEAEVGRATAQATREVEAAMRDVQLSRGATEREARRAARNMARTDEVRTRAAVEARIAGLRALEEARMAGSVAASAAPALAERDEAVREALLEAQQDQQEKAREARDQAREKEQERRELERDKREAERDRKDAEAERIDELYDQAMESIDEENWNDALRPLSKLMSLNMKVDAALYWTSYAQYKMDRTAVALATLARLQKEFPTSRWAREGKALEMEARGKSGQAPRPDQLDQEDDLDLKLMAVSALAQSDPQEAMPLLTRILASPSSSRKIRERSLFVLAQMGTEQAGNAIAEVARGNSSPELQRKAIQYLGVFGGPGNRKVLSDIYATSTDNAIRKQILNSFMVSGDKARVLAAARTEKDPELRASAVRLLGVMGGSAELSQMYQAALTTEEKQNILQALFIGGAVEPVLAAARGEKDKEARLTAIRNLGLMGGKSQGSLGDLYATETDRECKEQIVNALFLQNNPTKLVEIARAEKDPEMKKQAVHWLSLMNSKESRAYMMELLKD